MFQREISGFEMTEDRSLRITVNSAFLGQQIKAEIISRFNGIQKIKGKTFES